MTATIQQENRVGGRGFRSVGLRMARRTREPSAIRDTPSGTPLLSLPGLPENGGAGSKRPRLRGGHPMSRGKVQRA